MRLRALALCLLASPAMAFTASNGSKVQSTGPGTFTVPYQGIAAPTAFWCAAGDYATRVLGLPASARIYRASTAPRGAGQAVDFSLAPVPGIKTGLLLLGPDDGSITLGLAAVLCDSVD